MTKHPPAHPPTHQNNNRQFKNVFSISVFRSSHFLFRYLITVAMRDVYIWRLNDPLHALWKTIESSPLLSIAGSFFPRLFLAHQIGDSALFTLMREFYLTYQCQRMGRIKTATRQKTSDVIMPSRTSTWSETSGSFSLFKKNTKFNGAHENIIYYLCNEVIEKSVVRDDRLPSHGKPHNNGVTCVSACSCSFLSCARVGMVRGSLSNGSLN